MGAVATLCVASLATAAPSDAATAATSCSRHLVAGKQVCLRAGQRCVSNNQPDYLQAGFDCRRRKLARATAAALRQGRPLKLGASGRPTLAQALAAFDQLVAPLPGVRPPPGTVGESRSGSAAIAWLEGYRKRLTRAQRTVLDRVASQHGTTIAAAGGTVDQFIQIARDAGGRLLAKGVRLSHPVQVRLASHDSGGEYADTVAQWLYGAGSACLITVRPNLAAGGLRQRQLSITHELMHCAVGELLSSGADAAKLPAWVQEGLPEWAAYRIVAEWSGPFADSNKGNWWPTWLREHPQSDLFTRQYDALGFWALLEHEGLNIWPLLPVIVSDATNGSEAVYRTVTAATPGDYRGEWGSTMATHGELGRRWDLDGPGMRSPPVERATVDDDHPWGRTFGPRGGYSARVDLSSEVIEVSRTAGVTGFMRDAGGGEQGILEDERYCAKPGGCFCADGTELPFPPIPRGDLFIGAADQTSTGAVAVAGEPVSKHCPEGGAHGIVLFRKSVGGGIPMVAGFRSGPCRVLKKGRQFVAEATSGDYKLFVIIAPFRGHRRYTLRYDSADAFFIVTGPGGTFSNVYFPPPGTPPAAGGGIDFANHGKGMSLGFINAFNSTSSDSVTLAGPMRCDSKAKLRSVPTLPR